ncbi:isoprenyl transferase [Mycoplasma sp. P36-A1]|uniref:isoprenyl transferase n=1 Tax=Mycoplasma sp. P36-A1 TaxID=3252900 RepID=UPI003C2B8FE1
MKNEIKHLAVILDGNGRWAKQRNLPRIKGHYEGGKRVKEVAIAASKRGIKKMTVYAFSTENWKRPADEVNYIFKLPKIFLDAYLKDLMKHQIKIEYIGNFSEIPCNAQKSINETMEKTKNNSGMTLSFALNYGSKDEIVQASKKIASLVIENSLNIDDIDESLFNDNLMEKMPVDLVIRTSGEKRLSNFLLWQVAYSEFYFTDVLWPDFNETQLDIALDNYYQRNRRYGGLNDEE